MGNTMNTLAEPLTSKQTDQGSIELEVDSDKNRSGRQGSARRLGNPSLIRYAASSMQGWRVTMEDAHLLVPAVTINNPNDNISVDLKDHSLFAVFDGHGGDFTSRYACDNLLRVLTARKEMMKYARLAEPQRGCVPGIELLKSALEGAFLDLDDELCHIYKQAVGFIRAEERERRQTAEDRRPDEMFIRQLSPVPVESNSPDEAGVEIPLLPQSSSTAMKLDRSGSTVVAVLLTPSHILCANAGDSRAILVKSGKALPFSFDHKPTLPVEQSRISRAGGEVKMKRVDGDLAVSRGLGDFRFKGNCTLKAEHQKVSARPDVIVNPRDDTADEFLILACDGVWDVVDNDECGKAVRSILDSGETDLGLLCEELLDMCLDRNSRDNMTVCMVALPMCRIEEKDPINEKRGVQALRKRREASGLTPGEAKQARMVAQAAADALSPAATPTSSDTSQKKKMHPTTIDDVPTALALGKLMLEVAAQTPSPTE